MNRSFLPFPPIVLCTLWLTGCATPPPTAVPTPEVSPIPISTGDDRIPIRLFLTVDSYDLSLRSTGGKTADQALVDDFNASQDSIQLSLYPQTSDVMSTLTDGFASGDGPDIVGVLNRTQAGSFPGAWLDLSPYLDAAKFDLSQFPGTLAGMDRTPAGFWSLPFAVTPTVLFYNTRHFEEAGIHPPPDRINRSYTMPDGSWAEWGWDTVRQIALLLTLDENGKNATQAGFDRARIHQYGFSWGFDTIPAHIGSLWEAGTLLAPGGSPGQYRAQIPEAWAKAWQWTYDGIWGDQPFTPDFRADTGAAFSEGRIAMTIVPSIGLCCLSTLPDWDFGTLPVYSNGSGGDISDMTFRIWKGTPHPQEAFTVLAYLLTKGAQRLIIGSDEMPAPYALALPARPADQAVWLERAGRTFGEDRNWNILWESLENPHRPSTDGFLPNQAEAWSRGLSFGKMLHQTAGADLEKEMSQYRDDLSAIFNRQP